MLSNYGCSHICQNLIGYYAKSNIYEVAILRNYYLFYRLYE